MNRGYETEMRNTPSVSIYVNLSPKAQYSDVCHMFRVTTKSCLGIQDPNPT